MKSACKYTYIYIHIYVHTYIYITYRESERITERKKRQQILRPTYRTPECILIMN